MTTGTVRQFPVYAEGVKGYDDADSIEPIANGEALSETVLDRTPENLRDRLETVRDTLEDLLYLADAGRALIVAGPGKVTWPGSVTAGFSGIPVIDDAIFLVPGLTAGSAQTSPVPPVASTFGTLSIKRDTGALDAILVTSLLHDYQGGNKINVTVASGAAFTCVLADETTMSITIAATAATTLTNVINALNGLLNANGDNICTAALQNGAVGADIVKDTQSTIRISGNHDAEGHAITPAQVAAFFFSPTNYLHEGDSLCIQYDAMIDTSLLTAGGRRQALPENSNTEVQSGSLFNSRVEPSKLVNAVPICKVVNGRLCFVSGQQILPGAIDYDLGTGVAQTSMPDIMSNCVVNGLAPGAHVALVFHVDEGTFWLNGQQTFIAASTTTLDNNVTRYVYIDSAGALQNSGTAATALAVAGLLLYKVTTSGGAITATVDLRRTINHYNTRGIVTVRDSASGPAGDFTTLEGAIAWVGLQKANGEKSAFEIVVQSDLTLTSAITLTTGVTIRGSSAAGPVTITTPSATVAFPVSTGTVSNVTFKDIYFSLPITAGTALIAISGASTCHYWEIDNCVIDGGRDAHTISVIGDTPLVGWRITNNRFLNMAHTSTYGSIVLEQMSNARIANNEISGGTGDTNDDGIHIRYGSTGCVIENNTVTTGGIGVAVRNSNMALTLTNTDPVSHCVTKNRFKSTRDSAVTCDANTIVDRNYFEGCHFTGTATLGVVAIYSGPCIVTGNVFSEWRNGPAVSLTNDCKGSRIENNVMTTGIVGADGAVKENTASVGISVCNNTIDLYTDAAANAGQGLYAIDLSLCTSAVVNGNVIRNVGSTGTPSTGVIQVDNHSVVSGNVFTNCTGTAYVAGVTCSVALNVVDGVDTGTRIEDDLTVGGVVYHEGEHDVTLHHSAFQSSETFSAAPNPITRNVAYLSTASGQSVWAPLPMLKEGDHITWCQVWYNIANSASAITTSLRCLQLSDGSVSGNLWTDTDNTGNAVESLDSGAIDLTVEAGYAYFIEVTFAHDNIRLYGAMVGYTRPHP